LSIHNHYFVANMLSCRYIIGISHINCELLKIPPLSGDKTKHKNDEVR